MNLNNVTYMGVNASRIHQEIIAKLVYGVTFSSKMEKQHCFHIQKQ